MDIDEKIKKIATTLKNSGLVASMEEALERAKSMIHVGKKKQEQMGGMFNAYRLLRKC